MSPPPHLLNIRKDTISDMENELCATVCLSIMAYIINFKTLEMPLELVLEVTLTLFSFLVFLLKPETSPCRKYKLKEKWVLWEYRLKI